MTDRQRNGFILVLVAGLILASLVAIAGIPGAVKAKKTQLGLDLKGGVELIYQGLPTPQTPVVTQDALARAVDIMRNRVDQLGVAEPQIQTSGGNQITADLPAVTDVGRAERLVGTTARLEFYDWESNVLLPNGKTVASQLQTQDQNAIQISQGLGNSAPGDPGRRQRVALPGGPARLQATQEGQPRQLARGTAVLHVRQARQRRLRQPPPAPRGRRRSSGSTACSRAPTTTSMTCTPAFPPASAPRRGRC